MHAECMGSWRTHFFFVVMAMEGRGSAGPFFLGPALETSRGRGDVCVADRVPPIPPGSLGMHARAEMVEAEV